MLVLSGTWSENFRIVMSASRKSWSCLTVNWLNSYERKWTYRDHKGKKTVKSITFLLVSCSTLDVDWFQEFLLVLGCKKHFFGYHLLPWAYVLQPSRNRIIKLIFWTSNMCQWYSIFLCLTIKISSQLCPIMARIRSLKIYRYCIN